jgi:hypothetical protein
MSTVCLPLSPDRVIDRARRVRERWGREERTVRRRLTAAKCMELFSLILEPNLDQELWAAGSMTAADLERLYG